MRQSKKLVHSLFLSTWNASFNVQLMLMLMSTTMMIKICKFHNVGFFKALSIVPPAAGGGVQQAANPKLEVTPVSDNSKGHHFTDSNFSPSITHTSLPLTLLLSNHWSFSRVQLLGTAGEGFFEGIWWDKSPTALVVLSRQLALVVAVSAGTDNRRRTARSGPPQLHY